MADFNGNLPRKAAKAKLVVARLPLKVAVQCSILNKNLLRWICDPTFARRAAAHSPSMIFYCSGKTPKIFTRLCREIGPTASSLADRDSRTSVTLVTETIIMASCNGLLLLHFGCMFSHYVFNPTTGGIMFVDFPLDRLVGLAVDFSSDISHFKLVSLRLRRDDYSDRTFLTFSVLVPMVRNFGLSIVLKSLVALAAAAPAKADDGIQPVYARGSLFWLGDGGRTTVAFHVEKEQPRVVEGPVFEDGARGRWFGLAGGSVHFVYALPEEIVICGYDHGKEEWGEKHRIATLSNPSNNDYGNGEPLFYDGGRVFFLLRKRGEDGHVYIYDVVRDKWERSWNVAGWTDSKQLFFSFSPTIAKVSDSYLTEPNIGNDPFSRGNAFSGLMHLFRPETN